MRFEEMNSWEQVAAIRKLFRECWPRAFIEGDHLPSDDDCQSLAILLATAALIENKQRSLSTWKTQRAGARSAGKKFVKRLSEMQGTLAEWGTDYDEEIQAIDLCVRATTLFLKGMPGDYIFYNPIIKIGDKVRSIIENISRKGGIYSKMKPSPHGTMAKFIAEAAKMAGVSDSARHQYNFESVRYILSGRSKSSRSAP